VAWLIASFFHKGNEFDESEIDADDEAEENRHSAKNYNQKGNKAIQITSQSIVSKILD
jgi:hypothetical protein